MTNFVPITSIPTYYISGFFYADNNSTSLAINAGACRDSTNSITMILNNYLGQGTGTVNAISIINGTINGVNGLDTGSLTASSMYGIYIIGDSRGISPVGTLLSLSLPFITSSIPLLPFGYDSYRLVGYYPTDSSAHFISGLGVRNVTSPLVKFYYTTPQATSVTAGHATSLTGVSLLGLVPSIQPTSATIYTSYTPATAGNILTLSFNSFSGSSAVITGQVESVPVTTNSNILTTFAASTTTNTIYYMVGNSSDSVAISVAGFEAIL